VNALFNTNVTTEVYNKWFGVGVNETDSDVEQIMMKATDMMGKFENDWQPICCNDGTSGSCYACGDTTLAFVTSYTYYNDPAKYSSTWVRMCPNFWDFSDD
jgi:hypothetical protein